ncbi:hypothetical protein VTN31DRAFT_4691 [Thermomyces dupontii]|uniref:uncharacterized protein n=1 Tax=Talaromyces thermophilus TaxID=28565 RepID=UPI0037424D9E
MKIVLPLLGQVLLAVSATAVPAANRDRHIGALSVTPPIFNKTLVARGSGEDGTDWTGAVYTAPPDGTKFTGVSARFVVPETTFPAEYPDYLAGMVFGVGIDGNTNSGVMLTAGVHTKVTYLGETQYVASWQWSPTSWVHKLYDEIEVNPGDEFYVSIQTTSPKTATIIFENRTRGQKYVADATPNDPETGNPLRGENVHWAASNFLRLSEPIPPSNFRQIRFLDTWAQTESGAQVDSAGAHLLDFHFYARPITKTTRISPTEIDITYIGPP